MTYILLEFKNQKIYIEIDEKQNAVRQLNIDENCQSLLSCREDCLAEGEINVEDMEGDIEYISSEIFEEKWSLEIMQYQLEWLQTKKKYSIGSKIVGQGLFFYPQGIIVKGRDFYAVYKGDKDYKINQKIEAYVEEYDDKNMWLVLV